MKKTIIISLALLSIFLLFCKEETPVENEVEVYTFTGKVYTLVDSQKTYMENVKVFLRDDSTYSDNEGTFSFEKVPTGEYQIKFVFISLSDSVQTSTYTLTIGKEELFEEFQLHQHDVYSFGGKVYSLIDSQKVYLENVKVLFRGELTYTDNEGSFSFEEVPTGQYGIQFEYSSNDTNVSKSQNIIIEDFDKTEEFELFELQTEINAELFPLAIGNIWVYVKDDLSKEYWEIIETVVIDAETYYKMEIRNPIHNTVGYSNYRIDSNSGYLYRGLSSGGFIITNLGYEDGDYEIKSSDGQTYLWITVTTSNEDLFGEDQKVIKHKMMLQETEATYKFVEGIGIVHKYSHGYLGYGVYNDILIGAIIDNVEYGDTSYVEYDSDVYFYPLATGNKWFYEYNKYIEGGDTIRSTRLKREVLGEEIVSNGGTFFKIINTFDDSLNIQYYEWQKMNLAPAKLYGFDDSKNTTYTIEDYSTAEMFDYAESYMPSILQHHLTELSATYTDRTKSYYGWNSGAVCFSTVRYNFIKDIGISKIEVRYDCDAGKIIEKIELIGSTINGNTIGIVW